jgi:enamine deaminase RidA (YjgF/YER057c/UK114 family)
MPTAAIQRINPPTLPTPPGYSQVVTTTGGTLIVIAGQVALDANGNVVGQGNFPAQTEQVFRNIVAALEGAGASTVDLVKLTTYVTDLSNLAVFREMRDRFLDPAQPPASTLVQVSRLFRPEFLIEVEAMALRQ